VIQVLAHVSYGAIAYGWPRHWEYHFSCAEDASKELAALHDKVLEIEPGKNGIRLVTDYAFLRDVYRAGNDMVSHSVRAVQHLAEEIEREYKTKLVETATVGRINEASALFSRHLYNAEPDYAGICEIIGVRDALEHPQSTNTYSGDATGWDKVPLAWMLSDRSLAAWGRFEHWFRRVTEDWEHHRAKLSTRLVTLTVERGIESKLQVKNPSSRPNSKPK